MHLIVFLIIILVSVDFLISFVGHRNGCLKYKKEENQISVVISIHFSHSHCFALYVMITVLPK